VTDPREGAEIGPGILETSLVLGLSVLLAAVLVTFFGWWVADVVGMLMDAAHGGR